MRFHQTKNEYDLSYGFGVLFDQFQLDEVMHEEPFRSMKAALTHPKTPISEKLLMLANIAATIEDNHDRLKAEAVRTPDRPA